MFLRRIVLCVITAIVLLTLTSVKHAQKSATTDSPQAQPTPQSREDQEPVRVFTEEVRLPVIAFDDYGHFDPTLVPSDLIVFEDGVQQEITSVQRIPASVLLLLATGADINPAMRVGLTRDTALRLVSTLRVGDQMAVFQFANRVEVLQAWTEDEKEVLDVLKTKLQSGSGTRLPQAISAAAAYFVNQPVGNRHIVLVTDGVELPVARAGYQEAMKELAAGDDPKRKAEWDAAVKHVIEAQASVHIISYTEFTRLALIGKKGKYKGSNAPVGSVLSSGIQNAGIDPTMPPTGGRRGDPAYGDGINFDPQMRKLRKAYEKALKSSEQRLTLLADETGARLLRPVTAAEMLDRAVEVAHDIGAQYVVSYLPKRPLAEAKPGEYRRVEVAPRRTGLRVRSRRGYIATP